MANIDTLNSQLVAVGDAIRNKLSSQDKYKISEMPAAIQSIPSGGSPVIESKTITENGTYTAPTGVDGFSPVVVDVPAPEPTIESKTITENGTYNPPSGVDGYAPVVVNVPIPAPVIESKTITENGTYTAPSGVDGYSPIVVNVAGGGGKLSEITMAGCNGLLATPQAGTGFFLDPENVSYPFTIHVLETLNGAIANPCSYLAQGTKDLSNYILDFSQIPETMSYSSHGITLGNMFTYSFCETAEDLPQFVWDENKALYIYPGGIFQYSYYLKNISQNMKDFLIYTIKSTALVRPDSINAVPGGSACNLEDISYVTEGLRGVTYTGTTSPYASFNLTLNEMVKTITIPQIKCADKTVGYPLNLTIQKCCPRHIVFEPFTYDNTFCPKSGTISLQSLGNTDYTSIKPYLDKMGRLFVSSDAAAVANVDNPNAWAGDPLYNCYNIDSIKETFASLPDVTKSEYTGTKGTFVIKLGKTVGQNTYANKQGSAQYLTAEDKAVATAKGWTVTIS